MHNPCPMHFFQCQKHRPHRIQHFFAIHFSVFLNVLFYTDSINKLHDNVRSFIFIKEIKDGHNPFYFIKFGQTFCLIQKFLYVLLIMILFGIFIQVYFISMSADDIPADHFARKIFFDRHRNLQPAVPANIGNSEASLAQHFPQNIPVRKLRPRQKTARDRIVIFLFHSTKRTPPGLAERLHASDTKI